MRRDINKRLSRENFVSPTYWYLLSVVLSRSFKDCYDCKFNDGLLMSKHSCRETIIGLHILFGMYVQLHIECSWTVMGDVSRQWTGMLITTLYCKWEWHNRVP